LSNNVKLTRTVSPEGTGGNCEGPLGVAGAFVALEAHPAKATIVTKVEMKVRTK
jgi:hypothetical protein